MRRSPSILPPTLPHLDGLHENLSPLLLELSVFVTLGVKPFPYRERLASSPGVRIGKSSKVFVIVLIFFLSKHVSCELDKFRVKSHASRVIHLIL